jgi:hypothetical protein
MLGRTMAGKPVATDHTKPLRSMPVAEVDKDAVERIIQPIWFIHTHTASRIPQHSGRHARGSAG